MTEENTPVSAKENKPASVEEKIQISSDSDVLLILLINMAEELEETVNINITLFVQGLIVSGVLIGEKPYFEGLYNDLNLSVESKNDAQKFFEHYQSLSADSFGDQKEKSQFKKNIDYIHLKDVNYNSLTSNNRGGYWRGNLNRVDGFRLVNLTSI